MSKVRTDLIDRGRTPEFCPDILSPCCHSVCMSVSLNRLQSLVAKFCRLLSVLTVACALSNCSCMVSSKLGHSLDSVGYAEARELAYAADRPFYELNGCYYARVRLEYCSRQARPVDLAFCTTYGSNWQPTGTYIDGYLLMSAEDVEHQLKRKAAEPPEAARLFIPESEFPRLGAVQLPNRRCSHGCKIDGAGAEKGEKLNMCTLTSIQPRPYTGVPVQRSFGNYVRKPLVVLLSYGVDAPISLVGSAAYCLLITPPMIVRQCF